MSAAAAAHSEAATAFRDGDALMAHLRLAGVSPWQLARGEHVRPLEPASASDQRDSATDVLQAEIVLPARLPRKVLGFLPGHHALPRLSLAAQQPVGTTHASSTRAGPLISEHWPLAAIDRERRAFDVWLETFAPAWQALTERQRADIDCAIVWHFYLDVPDRHAEDGRATALLNARAPGHLQGLLDDLRSASGAWQPLCMPFAGRDGEPRAAFGERAWLDGADVVVDTITDWDVRHAAGTGGDDALYLVRLRVPREPLLQALTDATAALDALHERVSRAAASDAIRALDGVFD